MELDVRFLPGQDIEMMLQRIYDMIAIVKQEDPDIDWELSPIIRKRMPMEIRKDEPLIHLVREAVKKATGEYPAFRGMASPCDCEHLLQAGIPAVMFGPGNDRAIHVANEWIEIDEITKAMEIYTMIIMDFFS